MEMLNLCQQHSHANNSRRPNNNRAPKCELTGRDNNTSLPQSITPQQAS